MSYKSHLLIRFSGCMKGKRRKVNLLLLIIKNKVNFSPGEVEYFLYEQRRNGKNLGPKNGPGTAGHLEVVRVSSLAKIYKLLEDDCLVYELQENHCSIEKVYKLVRGVLRKEILRKIFSN